MIVMTHAVYTEKDETPFIGLFVHAVAYPCEHVWNIPIKSYDRMGSYEYADGVRIKSSPLNTPKKWYRAAENVLLSTGKVQYAKTETETKAGMKADERRVLVCKECHK